MTKVFTLNGKIINVGEWDYQIYQTELVGNPFLGEGDPPEEWDYRIRFEDVIGNPLPDGAIEEDRKVVESAKGRLLLADDWHSLRADAYPSIKDQFDAQWKGGVALEEMADIIKSIKEKYPKTEDE